MVHLHVKTGSRPYHVHIEAGALTKARRLIVDAVGERRLFVIADENVWNILGERLEAGLEGADWTLLSMPMGEKRKRLSTVEELCRRLHRAGADRHSIVVTFGGGVAGDMGGFVAASYMRGIDFVQVPTTLLAQVDASVGGKTGVNLASGKNLVGAFHQPRLVLIDPQTLDTLPNREYRAGIQEVVKHGVVRSPELFEFMEREHVSVLAREGSAEEFMIAESVRIKADVVGQDERETGLRRIVNFGHTLGHALEAETEYFLLHHGEAVGFGMIAAAKLSQLRGRLSTRDCARIEKVVHSYTPVGGLDNIDAWRITRRISGDKKSIGGMTRFVLVNEIGVVSEDIDPPAIDVLAATQYALDTCRQRAIRPVFPLAFP